MLRIKIRNSLNSKLEELLEKTLIAGKLFLNAVELHHTDLAGDLLEFSFITIFHLFTCIMSLDNPDPVFVRDGSRLIAKLAKKYPEFGDALKLGFNLNCNVAMISEQDLAQLIRNIEL
jgi:hypothetical protein